MVSANSRWSPVQGPTYNESVGPVDPLGAHFPGGKHIVGSTNLAAGQPSTQALGLYSIVNTVIAKATRHQP